MWRIWLMGALFVVVAGAAWHYKHTLSENARLKIEINTANSTVKALDLAAKKERENYERERKAINEIDNAPDSDDGPIAPVLRRTIDRLQNHGN